jgi:hypothetical protein
MSLLGVGVKVADKILEMRKAKWDLELEDLSHVQQICTLGRFCIFYELFSP